LITNIELANANTRYLTCNLISGKLDVPKMRKSDIVFILNVILNSLCPGSPRLKTASEANSTSIMGIGGGSGGATRSGSVTEKKVKLSTCQIGFLGMRLQLKIPTSFSSVKS